MHNLYSGQELSDLEKKILAFFDEQGDSKAKDYLLGDLSWADFPPVGQTREEILAEFFTKRYGKIYLDVLPEDLKNKILAYSL